jgi:hypothetical protein
MKSVSDLGTCFDAKQFETSDWPVSSVAPKWLVCLPSRVDRPETPQGPSSNYWRFVRVTISAGSRLDNLKPHRGSRKLFVRPVPAALLRTRQFQIPLEEFEHPFLREDDVPAGRINVELNGHSAREQLIAEVDDRLHVPRSIQISNRQ